MPKISEIEISPNELEQALYIIELLISRSAVDEYFNLDMVLFDFDYKLKNIPGLFDAILSFDLEKFKEHQKLMYFVSYLNYTLFNIFKKYQTAYLKQSEAINKYLKTHNSPELSAFFMIIRAT